MVVTWVEGWSCIWQIRAEFNLDHLTLKPSYVDWSHLQPLQTMCPFCATFSLLGEWSTGTPSSQCFPFFWSMILGVWDFHGASVWNGNQKKKWKNPPHNFNIGPYFLIWNFEIQKVPSTESFLATSDLTLIWQQKLMWIVVKVYQLSLFHLVRILICFIAAMLWNTDPDPLGVLT